MNKTINIQSVVDRVPDYKVFLTVDEMDESTRQLADEFPDIVTVFEAGKSRNGHSIECIKIGNGKKNALCFACPHPNEPIGAMTMEYFSRALAEDANLREALGFTWYIIKCIDPDGARLNEGWFKGPFNIYNYTKHFFRPVGFEQVEWTFPVDYKELHFHEPLPETQALMKIIDEIKPEFMYSLHNAGFGGAYWYISKDIPEIYEDLRSSALKQGVALSLGEPEAPYIKEFSPAVFQIMGVAQSYDYTEKFTGKAPTIHSGTSSADYASTKADCVTLLTELPYFFDERVQDLSEGDITRKEALLKNIEMNKNHYNQLKEYLSEVRPYLTERNPFVKLVDQIIVHQEEGSEAKKNWASSSLEFEQPAKIAQIFDNLYTARFYNGLSLGLSIRTYDYEIARLEREGNIDFEEIEKLKNTHRRGLKWLEEYCKELEHELNYSVIPIQKLVRIQVESGLIVASHLSKNK
ncbi:M14 family zinc carboxypeptidase [Robertmurraya sp. DFI.2.37]|uniref:M14 family zinc carboxypeptidase n=1 Tax=Robertmurraya sp. DFI.2.37 TaxID=3031819 RepID=UPI001CD919D7|nr:M14 family zinc carboxypeptidase [Robertmurraya sp. DFI.2.37]MDF1507242.1 M14 family zinc carboxypeptidase [Robertmurraya sp. DFI.2.37]